MGVEGLNPSVDESELSFQDEQGVIAYVIAGWRESYVNGGGMTEEEFFELMDEE